MKNQSSNTTNILKFFNESTIPNIENQVHEVITLLKAGSIYPDQATTQLQSAERDIHRIFWAITSTINHYRTFIDSYQHYVDITGHRPASSLNHSNNPAASSLIKGYNDYQSGRIDFSAWKRIAGACKNALKSEIQAIQNEVNDLLNKSINNRVIVTLDVNQPTNYCDDKDDQAGFRVQVNNARFGFTEENDSDQIERS